MTETDEPRPWVILVHGMFRSSTTRLIRRMAEFLWNEGYGVLTLDMRGFGQSTKETLFTESLGLREGLDINKAAVWLPDGLKQYLAGKLLGNKWFARHVVMDRWFLHTHQTVLTPN